MKASGFESGEHGSGPNDPIRFYLREMAVTPLLSRDEELALARQIEAARAASVIELAIHPAALDELASMKREIAEAKAAVSAYVIGFGDGGCEAVSPGSVDSNSENETIGGLDAEPGADSPAMQAAVLAQLARIDEAALRMREALSRHGFGAAPYRRALRELGARLTALRFTARAIERMALRIERQLGATGAMDEPACVASAANATESISMLPAPIALRIHDRLRAIDRCAAEAKARLLKGNLRLVVSIAKRYPDRGLPLLDLIQEGNVGLMKAIERYDHRRGFKFSTYATWWIRQAVLGSLGDQGRVIRVPVHTADSLSKLNRITLDCIHRSGSVPNHATLAKKMGVSIERVRDLTNVVKDPVSMETLMAPGSDTTIGDAIADIDSPTPEEAAMARHMRRAVTAAIDQLPEREAKVLRLRYGIGVPDEHSLREVGRQLNLSAERVRQIEVMAIERLRGSPGVGRLRAYVGVSE